MAQQRVPDLNLALTCLRVALGSSQKQLANTAGISPNLLSDYERGRKHLNGERVARLVAGLGLEPEAVEEARSFVARIRRFEAPAPDLDLGRRSEEEPATAVSAEAEREHLNAAVAQIRLLRGWKQKDLAAAAGMPPSSISNYERGTRTPSRRTLLRLANAAGVSQAVLDGVLALVRSRSAPRAHEATPAAALPSPPPLALAVARLPGAASPDAPTTGCGRRQWIEITPSATADRVHAHDLWLQLEGRSAGEMRLLIEREPNLRHWALCELIANQSLTAVHHCAVRATELAGLAMRVAELYPGEESCRLRLLGYAWGHLANAHRVRGDLGAAADAFHRCKRFWRRGPAVSTPPLSASRLQSLEVSMCHSQWRLTEAIELADQALAVPDCDEIPALLNNKAVALARLGHARESLRIFAQLHSLVGADAGFCACLARHGLVHSLYDLGLYSRAESLLPTLRRSILPLGRELFLLRLNWLEGLIAAAKGRWDEAFESLTQVRTGFITRNMEFDAAAAGLQLADLLLARGRTEEAWKLAGTASDVARSRGLCDVAQIALDRLRIGKGPRQSGGERRHCPLHLYDWKPARPASPEPPGEPAMSRGLSDQEQLTREFQRWARRSETAA